jgi:hypothetical protein
MQLIRAINKSNKSNNNNNSNQTSSASYNNNNNNNTNHNAATASKVVIVAPKTSDAVSSHQAGQNASWLQQPPVSPSVSLPPLKKRTSIVKQSVPPPPPPRKKGPHGSPSKSKKLFGSVFSHSKKPYKPLPLLPPPHSITSTTIDVDKLKCLSIMEESGSQKVEKWLETVEIHVQHFNQNENEISISVDDDNGDGDDFKFKSVRKLIENFTVKGNDDGAKNSTAIRNRSNVAKVSDCSFVKAHVESYNAAGQQSVNYLNLNATRSSNETDSGIEISSQCKLKRGIYSRHYQFSRDGELV